MVSVQGVASIPLGATQVSGIATLSAAGTPKIVSAASVPSVAGLRVVNPAAVGQSTIKVTPVAGGVRTAGMFLLLLLLIVLHDNCMLIHWSSQGSILLFLHVFLFIIFIVFIINVHWSTAVLSG
jgi:hypothetical protein